MFEVHAVSLDDPQVRDLLVYHQRDMLAISSPGTSFALTPDGLANPDIALFGAWEHSQLAAIAALRRLSEHHAEIKSMRTHTDYLGKGAAKALLDQIVALASKHRVQRLSLETGTSEAFQPAISLYQKYGFTPGEAFADYFNGPHNQCYHLQITESLGPVA